jgi:putative sigma-54 modulation protein
MQVEFTFRTMLSSEAIKSHTTEKIKKLQRYLGEPMHASVIMSLERYQHCAHVTVTSGAHVFSASHESEDMYVSIDAAIDRIDGQIRRHKSSVTRGRRNGRRLEAAVARPRSAAAAPSVKARKVGS